MVVVPLPLAPMPPAQAESQPQSKSRRVADQGTRFAANPLRKGQPQPPGATKQPSNMMRWPFHLS